MEASKQLAIHGGTPFIRESLAAGSRLGEEEKRQVIEALDQGTLLYFGGKKTKQMEALMAEMYGARHAVASSSGTAAVHAAVGALGIGPGDEVLVPAITDMGSVIGILYQNAIPVFMDMDETTFNFDPEEIRRKATSRTKAVLVVHLAGYPCEMEPILQIAEELKLAVIEDCAQAWHAKVNGRLVGTMGAVGCFSFNDYKHLTTGEGGICITNNKTLAERIRLYTDKCYFRDGSNRRCEFLAPNYRISEVCSAIAIAQLGKLESIVERRRIIGSRLTTLISRYRGLYPAAVPNGGESSYWYFMVRVEEQEFGLQRDEYVKALLAEGVPARGSHIPVPIYDYEVFRNRSAYPGTKYPFVNPELGLDYRYDDPGCPRTPQLLKKTVIINISELYTDRGIELLCGAIAKVNDHFAEERG